MKFTGFSRAKFANGAAAVPYLRVLALLPLTRRRKTLDLTPARRGAQTQGTTGPRGNQHIRYRIRPLPRPKPRPQHPKMPPNRND